MSLDTVVMWACAAVNIWVYAQIGGLAAWVLFHHRQRIGPNYQFEMAATLFVAVVCVAAQIIQAQRGMVACQGIELKLALAFVVFGSGRYIHASLVRRESFLSFRRQEEDTYYAALSSDH